MIYYEEVKMIPLVILSAGFEMAGGLFLQLNAQLGMLKINPEDNRLIQIYSDQLSVKNTGFGLSMGYRF
jgi:hypothetical protein